VDGALLFGIVASFWRDVRHPFVVHECARALINCMVSPNIRRPNLPSQTWRYVQLWQELTWFRFSLGSDKPHLSEARKNQAGSVLVTNF